MKKKVILSTYLIATGLLLAQPGKTKGPGGQYGERMEMMMVWKLTDHLGLSQKQAEKFFPIMRDHQKELMEIRKEEMELFDPTFTKVKKGEIRFHKMKEKSPFFPLNTEIRTPFIHRP